MRGNESWIIWTKREYVVQFCPLFHIFFLSTRINLLMIVVIYSLWRNSPKPSPWGRELSRVAIAINTVIFSLSSFSFIFYSSVKDKVQNLKRVDQLNTFCFVWENASKCDTLLICAAGRTDLLPNKQCMLWIIDSYRYRNYTFACNSSLPKWVILHCSNYSEPNWDKFLVADKLWINKSSVGQFVRFLSLSTDWTIPSELRRLPKSFMKNMSTINQQICVYYVGN